LADSDSPRLFVVHLGEDDPSKCTAVKLKRLRLVSFRYARNRGLLLDPFSPFAISREDAKAISSEGLVAVDGSWKFADRSFRRIGWSSNKRKAIPMLIAANPTNYGKPYKLSTAEALAAALYITGFADVSREILGKFRWGNSFFRLNERYLEAYAGSGNSSEVVRVQTKILGMKFGIP
jgi:pre-rRNA-processing protein TSR3